MTLTKLNLKVMVFTFTDTRDYIIPRLIQNLFQNMCLQINSETESLIIQK